MGRRHRGFVDPLRSAAAAHLPRGPPWQILWRLVIVRISRTCIYRNAISSRTHRLKGRPPLKRVIEQCAAHNASEPSLWEMRRRKGRRQVDRRRLAYIGELIDPPRRKASCELSIHRDARVWIRWRWARWNRKAVTLATEPAFTY